MRGLLIVIALLGAGAPALAGVNLRNGNLFVSFTDLVFDGDDDRFELERTYNSKSTHKGLFGLGWGSWVETRVWVRKDGTVRLDENGSGAAVTFRPLRVDRLAFEVGLQTLGEAWLDAAPDRATAGAVGELPTLRASAGHRAALARTLHRRGAVPIGQRFTNGKRGRQVLSRTATGWLREQPRWVDRFDDRGRLVSRAWPGLTVRLIWGGQGRLLRLEDTRGRWMRLTYEGKQVASATSSTGGRVVYRHDRRGQLVWSHDQGGHRYWYAYDGSSNLVRQGYADRPPRRSSFEHPRQFLRATAAQGAALWYRYGGAKVQEWTEVWQGPDPADPARPSAVRVAYQIARDRRGYQSRRQVKVSLMCAGQIRRPKLTRYCSGDLSKGRYRWHNHGPDGREVHWIEDCAGTRPAPKK